MNFRLTSAVAACAACLSLSAMAADPVPHRVEPGIPSTSATPATTPPATDPAVLSSKEARDLKTESKAHYKASKKIAEADKDVAIAECKTSGLSAKEMEACKRDAKKVAKEAKRDAKQLLKEERADINANMEPTAAGNNNPNPADAPDKP